MTDLQDALAAKVEEWREFAEVSGWVDIEKVFVAE